MAAAHLPDQARSLGGDAQELLVRPASKILHLTIQSRYLTYYILIQTLNPYLTYKVLILYITSISYIFYPYFTSNIHILHLLSLSYILYPYLTSFNLILHLISISYILNLYLTSYGISLFGGSPVSPHILQE